MPSLALRLRRPASMPLSTFWRAADYFRSTQQRQIAAVFQARKKRLIEVIILPPCPCPSVTATVGVDCVTFERGNQRVLDFRRKDNDRARSRISGPARLRPGAELPMKPVAIICSRDVELYIILEHILGVDGYKTLLAGNVEEATERSRETIPAAIILDCRPGGLPVAALCALLKQDPATRPIPLVALIAPGAEDQHIALLKVGVDDSLVRPLVPAKLLASLRSKHTAGARGNVQGHHVLIFGEIEMRPDSFRVRRGESEIQLGAIEFRLLRKLAENPGQTFSREELIAAAWPNNIHVDTRTVDVHVSRLRKSLQELGPGVAIRTVRSAGYMFVDSNADRAADVLSR